MILVGLRRVTVVLAVLFVAAWLAPARADAGVARHHDKRARACLRSPTQCLALKWHNRLSNPRRSHRPGSDDAVDDFDDRDTQTDPGPDAAAVDNDGASLSDPEPPLPWVCARRAADPRAERLIVWRRLAAPRPPPSL